MDFTTQTPYLNSLRRLLTSDSTPKLGLDRIQKLLDYLGNPQDSFASIHVAGTNGKGSTCAFINSLAMSSGLSVGLFTSPHLLSCRERIQLNGDLISESEFGDAEEIVYRAMNKIGEQVSFFEQITAMAFWYFSQKNVDLAVIEVGLGGRLDATNVIVPIASVITRIDLDHTHILGDSLKAIAHEKGGIIKPGIPIVSGFQEPEVEETLKQIAGLRKSPFTQVNDPCHLPISLKGAHQNRNAALAIYALEVAGITLSENQVKEGLLGTVWPCRFEFIQEAPDVILDGAHNVAGLKALVAAVKSIPKLSEREIVLVFGTTEGHDTKKMLNVLLEFGAKKAAITTQSMSPRASDPLVLNDLLGEIIPSFATSKVSEAVALAEKIAGRNGLIIVSGSLYVAGEARALFRQMPTDPQLPIF